MTLAKEEKKTVWTGLSSVEELRKTYFVPELVSRQQIYEIRYAPK
jgi:hypothetical protein